ncbi:uncharacterized protein LOC107261594 [Ricinus communis]|uniref:uncharacterized protein LOC107261594 n=1 Tax=Ricinus communis TaxID=3988 RepID=UPI00077240B0|nr:uncharacterized protein LOC107261594 [Ricinus communis]|eukprot:XP_015577347.1 uncharacterized protein LOC107261594 [Ricinus communis]
MEPEIQQKIEHSVLEILKMADMEEMTEFKVRVMASERLGIDLNNFQCKRFIRGIVESFLLSTMEVVAGEEGKDTDPNFQQEAQVLVHEQQKAISKKEFDSEGNLVICKLSNRRNVVIHDFVGKSFVSIREFYYKDGRQLPSNKGINLPAEQWLSFRKSVPLIEEAITKMQSKLRSNPQGETDKQISMMTASTPCELNGKISNLATASHNKLNGQVSNLIDASTPHDLNGQVSKSLPTTTSHELNRHVSDSVIISTIHGIVPVEINRFDGKNYQCWAPVMELFLKQLNIAYVLTDPCPSVARRPDVTAEEVDQAKAAEQKWFNDDYICRRNILVCLSDALYNHYSKKTKSAKELWEELKLVYLYEEFGQKRSLVRKYIEFQIVDEKPILEQIQELNSIADSIVAAEIFFDEKFHVSTIISKLPPSWKDVCMKLMCEEYLPFGILMDRVRMEEESRNQGKQVEPPSSACFDNAKNLGPRVKDKKKPGLNGKRRETEPDNKVLVCYFCGKKGHISKHCRDKKLDKENPSTTAVTENAVAETKTEN